MHTYWIGVANDKPENLGDYPAKTGSHNLDNSIITGLLAGMADSSPGPGGIPPVVLDLIASSVRRGAVGCLAAPLPSPTQAGPVAMRLCSIRDAVEQRYDLVRDGAGARESWEYVTTTPTKPRGPVRQIQPRREVMDPAVQSYIDAIPEEHKPLFNHLQSLILALDPGAEIGISYKIPTYKVGRRRVFLGLWKGGVSLHAVPVDQFKQRHPSIKTGKGSLNFRLTDELPEAHIREVIKRAMDRA